MVGPTGVDAQTSNEFYDDFCVYSDTQVELNNHNFLETGTTVTTPEGAGGITVPSGGWTSNPGLLVAVRTDHMPLAILDKFDVIEANLTNPASRFHQDYLTTSSWTNVNGNQLDQSDFPPSGMYLATCGTKITLNGVIRDVVIKTACKVQFANNAAIENTVLINTNTGAT